MKPSATTYPSYYEKYVQLLPDEPINALLERQLREIDEVFSQVPDSKADYRYAKGKWSVKEVLGHLLDAERIFAYRALCIARGEHQSLPGFEEDDYVRNGFFGERNLDDLLVEFMYLRKSNLQLFYGLSEEALNRNGKANNLQVNCRAVFWIMAGHVQHHLQVIRERYL
ncbi:MAG: DinB family protein [Bacteroidia bacterium]|nr:DinB family protein [Bacteroidia bacterium]